MMPERVVYEATVVTGLEATAANDCKHKLKDSNIRHDQGRVFIETNLDVDQILALRSVDNVFIVIYDSQHQQLPQDKQQLNETLAGISSQANWRIGLTKWMQVFQYKDADLDTILNNEKSEKKPSFRVTCNRHGDEHRFTSQEAAAAFGSVINESFHWPVIMKNFDIEVILNIKEKHFYVCIALTRESLHHRNLVQFGPTSLRATIAYNMLSLAKIQVGEIVCDPMCGSGSIPVECKANWPQAFMLAGDIHPIAVQRTLINCCENTSNIDVTQFDVTSFPFRDNFIDVFVTDLPFGKRLGSKFKNKTLYPALLQEMARCAKINHAKAILLTQDKRGMNYALGDKHIKRYWITFKTVFVKIGGLQASIYCLKRTQAQYQ